MFETSRLPERDPLPRYLAPVPKLLEDLGLRFAWLVVAINLVGTAFGFWYYSGQFAETATVMWPWVPDSPMATLLIALAIAAWKLGHELPWLTALAFFGNVILGLWTPYTLLVFSDSYAYLHPLMFQFLFWSHLAMVVQAFVLHRITDFPVWGVAVALAWYASNLIVDYFIPVVGDPHHTTIPVERETAMFLEADALGVIAAGEVTFTLLALFLALATRVKKCERAEVGRTGGETAGTDPGGG
ncbi:DUF1405 domain-containing protein [Natronorubrum daqingense]|uniref:Uncharacterized membrane protein YpjA n=1 Tax=Natronorubrum daqingense TaxID=588898 RepID=A0A1N7A6H2_9EURY|nr:DUF1405 domain-containing protein [Natronorubrum daqingense]APX95128.1 hypothetical protein BB347_00115 [Natronorubrum daqingense]SIR34596.1 Uncharacterized membrane protein YpjA [Natronorubrum daqingense]